MRMVDIILKKRRGQPLSPEEIRFFIKGYTRGDIPDYQASALLMAIFFQRMDREETIALTKAMMESGDILDLSDIQGFKVDKHSTGGVGDTTTLILGPMVAAAGAPVAKMSGRGLGHTGGTIDKLESFQGFRTELSKEEFVSNVNRLKLSIASQTGDLAPADKLLYALRDVTATVDDMSLIASSIMSKKLAAGADAIVLDVKTGSGAFMKTLEDSKRLAELMVDIGNGVGRRTVALISDMDQPLGRAVGNALEIREAIQTLQGRGPEDLFELCLALGAQMLILAEVAENEEDAREKLLDAVHNGLALKKFKELIHHQGGDAGLVDEPQGLPQASLVVDVPSPREGYVSHIQADEVGASSLVLGAGRETKESSIDLSAGVLLLKKVGDWVKQGESIAKIHTNDQEKIHEAMRLLINAYSFSKNVIILPPLIHSIIK